MPADFSSDPSLVASASLPSFSHLDPDAHSRRDFLLALVQGAIEAHEQWADDDQTSYVTSELDERFTDLIDGFSEGTIPAGCRQLESRVAVFATQWRAWQAEVDRRGSIMVPPPHECWAAWEAITDHYRGIMSPPPPPLESVATLRAQQVGDRQICEIYGWIDEQGRAETWKVEQELATPGKHTTGWVDPITAKRQQAAANEQALAAKVRRLRDRKIQRMEAVAPESLEELVQQKVSLQQIALMLRLTEAEVINQCDQQGLPRPEGAPPLAAIPTGSQWEPELNDAQQRQMEAMGSRAPSQVSREDTREDEGRRLSVNLAGQSEQSNQPEQPEQSGAVDLADLASMSLEQQIIHYYQAGFEATDIAKEVSTEDEQVTYQKVNAVVRRWKDDPTAFEEPE